MAMLRQLRLSRRRSLLSVADGDCKAGGEDYSDGESRQHGIASLLSFSDFTPGFDPESGCC
jgi:hypothetical protein